MTGILASVLLSSCISTARAPIAVDTPTVTASGQGQAEIEARILRAQLETARQYDQRLVETVYWGLGTVVTIAIALVGFGAFANLRLYERDKASLREELRRENKDEIGRIERSLREGAAGLQKTLQRTTNEAARGATESAVAKLTTDLDNLRFTMLLHQYDFARQRVLYWRDTRAPSNVLSEYAEMGLLAIRMGKLAGAPDEFRINDVLDGILGQLTVGTKANSGQVKSITEFLNELPDSYAQNKEMILPYLR